MPEINEEKKTNCEGKIKSIYDRQFYGREVYFGNISIMKDISLNPIYKLDKKIYDSILFEASVLKYLHAKKDVLKIVLEQEPNQPYYVTLYGPYKLFHDLEGWVDLDAKDQWIPEKIKDAYIKDVQNNL